MDEEYTVYMVPFPGDINGAVRVSPDGWASIYINDWLSPMARKRAFKHELQHIANDDFYNSKSIEEVEECHDRKNSN